MVDKQVEMGRYIVQRDTEQLKGDDGLLCAQVRF